MNKIIINNKEDLNKLRHLSKSKSYLIELNSDLDMHGEKYQPINMENIAFIFNGNNNVIRNLCIDRESESNLGFFSIVTSGIIKNLIFDNAYVSGKQRIGIVSGIFEGCITNVKINGSVKGEHFVGSLIGESYNKISLYDDSFNGITEGVAFIGGLVGKGNQTEIINSNVEGTIYFNDIHMRNTIGKYCGNSKTLFVKENMRNTKLNILSKGTYGLIFS